MTFGEYILKKNREKEEYEVLIDNSDMPATFVGDEMSTLSEYAYEKYGEILNAECEVVRQAGKGYGETVEVYSDNYKMGRDFTYEYAGYTGLSEYDRLFPKVVGRIYYAGEKIVDFTETENFSKELLECVNNGIGIDRVDDYTNEGLAKHYDD